MNLNNIFKNKKVIITGHTGFKGSWLTMLLKQLGAEIKGYALNNVSSPNHFDLLDITNDIGDSTPSKQFNSSLYVKLKYSTAFKSKS